MLINGNPCSFEYLNKISDWLSLVGVLRASGVEKISMQVLEEAGELNEPTRYRYDQKARICLNGGSNRQDGKNARFVYGRW